MKLLLDQGLPRSAVPILKNHGIDTVHVGDIGFATAEDRTILEYARANNYIIVTLDADFHTILALTGAGSPSAIRIRIEGLRAAALADLLSSIKNSWETDLDTGIMLTVQSGHIRARRLPIL